MTTTKAVEYARGDLVQVFKAGDENNLLLGRIRWGLSDGWYWIEVFEKLMVPKKYRFTELVVIEYEAPDGYHWENVTFNGVNVTHHSEQVIALVGN